jgi:hypothetical protein
LVGRLVGRSVGWSVSRSVGWLVGRSIDETTRVKPYSWPGGGCSIFSLSVAQQSKSGPRRLVVDVSRLHTHTHSHTHTHTHTLTLTHAHTHIHPVGYLWTSDQLVTEAATYTTLNKCNWRIFMPSARFEPATPAIELSVNAPLPGEAFNILPVCMIEWQSRVAIQSGRPISFKAWNVDLLCTLKCHFEPFAEQTTVKTRNGDSLDTFNSYFVQ